MILLDIRQQPIAQHNDGEATSTAAIADTTMTNRVNQFKLCQANETGGEFNIE